MVVVVEEDLAGILGFSALFTGGGLEARPFGGFDSEEGTSDSGFGVEGLEDVLLEC